MKLLFLLLLGTLISLSSTFQPPPSFTRAITDRRTSLITRPVPQSTHSSTTFITVQRETALHGFNLGGGPPQPSNGASNLIPIGLGLLFLFSPLGSIFFSITNSIFLFTVFLIIVVPLGFQLYQTLFLVSAPCPSCGQAAVALKNGDPNTCQTCGSTVRSTVNKDGLEISNNTPDFIYNPDDKPGSSFFDMFGGDPADMKAENFKKQPAKKDVAKRKREVSSHWVTCRN